MTRPAEKGPTVSPGKDALKERYGLDFDEIMSFIDEETLSEQERTMLAEAQVGSIPTDEEISSLIENLFNGPRRRKPPEAPRMREDEEEYEEMGQGPGTFLESPRGQGADLELTPAPGTIPVTKWWLQSGKP